MSGSFHAAKFITLPIANTTNPTNPIDNPWSGVLQGSTIASGATDSGVLDATACLVCNITCPSSLRGVSTVTIKHSRTPNGTFTTLKQLNSATDYTVTLTASSTVPIDTGLTAGLGYIKFVANTVTSGGTLALEVGAKAAA